ncbi:MAG: FKBP-type peptidyl-prolyl cis-trans isomerase, partial [Bacteroidales bacterium]|nr:FKBP-type peptidyl-prolyl cis-trans isomerase [Bacteroidales bacterium]
EMVKGMRIGGTRTAIIPSWLNYKADYETVDEYLKNNSEGVNAIYTISVLNKTDDIVAWELDTLERYVATNMSGVDSLKTGYYYKTIREPSSSTKFSTDTTFFINYTGRLLNGHVFDTTIEDTAKVHGIWSSKKTYAPKVITMNEEYSKITMAASYSEDGSTVVDGFAYCLSMLGIHEKGVCAFYSQLGYGASGSSGAIPAYAPIVFEIEAVDEPD